jgi:type II secretory pathway component PulK
VRRILSQAAEASRPAQGSSTSAACGRSSGFALIVVLWALVLIAFIVLHIMASGRTKIRIPGNLIGNAMAAAAADGTIFEAIFNLMDPQADQRWPTDGTTQQLVIGESRVVVRLEDEAGWINPNAASPALLEAGFTLGPSNARATALLPPGSERCCPADTKCLRGLAV